jgi:hypothetical protein
MATMQPEFPTVKKSELAKAVVLSCFNCYQDFFDPWFFETKNADGRGKYFVCCESCRMNTYFDIEED